MNNTLIQNKGITETIINDNNRIHVNRTNWGANYDGKTANILLDSITNGKHNVLNIKLDNEDLARLLNVPADNVTLDKRLLMDFAKQKKIKNRTLTPYKIELDDNNNNNTTSTTTNTTTPNEEFIITSPYALSNRNSYSFKKYNKSKSKTHSKRYSSQTKRYSSQTKRHTKSKRPHNKSYRMKSQTRRNNTTRRTI